MGNLQNLLSHQGSLGSDVEFFSVNQHFMDLVIQDFEISTNKGFPFLKKGEFAPVSSYTAFHDSNSVHNFRN